MRRQFIRSLGAAHARHEVKDESKGHGLRHVVALPLDPSSVSSADLVMLETREDTFSNMVQESGNYEALQVNNVQQGRRKRY